MDNIVRTQQDHTRFYCLLSLLLVLISLRYSLQIDVPPILFLAIIICMALLGDLNELVGIFICCIALHESIDLFYALVFCVCILVCKFHKEIRLHRIIWPIFAMIVWELLHCFRADFSVRTYLVSCIPLLVLAIFMCIDVRKIDYAFVGRAFSIALAVICMSLLLKLLYLSDFNIIKTFAKLQRLGNDASAISLDGKGTIQTNSLGILCVLAITWMMQLRTVGSGTKGDIILVILLTVFGALTASRTYLVCLSLMLILLLFSQNGSLKKKFRFLAGMVALILVALVLLYLIFPDLMEYYISRFAEKDITTGRDVLMIKYGEFISDHPKVMFWGIGLNQYGYDLITAYKVASNVPHNCIQEIILAWGIPGLVLFICLWIAMMYRSVHFSERQKLLNYIPFIIIFVKSQAGQMLTSSYTMLTLSVAYLSMAQDFNLQMRIPIRFSYDTFE